MLEPRNALPEIAGWYGAAAIVAAYALVSFEVVESDSALFQTLNLTGALGIVWVSVIKRAWQPAALNVMWAVIAAVALISIAL